MSDEETVTTRPKAERTGKASAHLGRWYVDDGVGVEFFKTLAEAEMYAEVVFSSDLAREVQRAIAERDRARSIATALEQELAEALRVARLPVDGFENERNDDLPYPMRALRRIVRILSADLDNDEKEQEQ